MFGSDGGSRRLDRVVLNHNKRSETNMRFLPLFGQVGPHVVWTVAVAVVVEIVAEGVIGELVVLDHPRAELSRRDELG